MREGNRLERLFKSEIVIGIFKGLLEMIYILVAYIIYNSVSSYLFGIITLKKETNTILVSSRSSNTMIASLLGLGIIISIFIYIQSQMRIIQINKNKKSPQIIRIGSMIDDSEKEKLKSKKIFCILATILLGASIFYLVNNYIAVYKDKIVITNIIPALEKKYDLDDVKKAELGVVNGRTKKGVKYKDLIYEITLKNNKIIDISNASIKELITFDLIIKNREIKREMDDYYLEDLIKYYDTREQAKYRILFR